MVNRIFEQLLVLCIVLAASLTDQSSAQEIDPALFGSLPTVSAAEISPDGNTIAQIQSKDGVRAIAFYDLSGETPPIGVEIGNVDARDLKWAGDNHVIVLVSASKSLATGGGIKTYEFWRWISVNRLTGEFSYFFSGASRFDLYFFSGRLYSTLPNDPNYVLMSHYGRHGTYSLFEVDLNSGKEKLAWRGDESSNAFGGGRRAVDWVTDADGTPSVRIDYDYDREERLFFKPADNHDGRALASTLSEGREEDSKLTAYALAGAANLIHASAERDGYRGLHIFDVDEGIFTKAEITAPGYDISSVYVDPYSANVVGVQFTDDLTRTEFIHPKLRAVQASLEKAVPNAAISITSWSRDFSKFMAKVIYSDHPDQYFLFDRQNKSFSMTAPSYKSLDGKVYAKKEKFDYRSSDGLTISGYLTVPANTGKAPAPLIVLPHGGPWARDDQSFDWWSFFYAARGYLVYQPNFRGSTGYGIAFKEAGHGEWGGKMQDDITEGVQKLIADGVADPDRICIVGASYGGYAALAGATLTPDLYACAVSVNGISNIMQLLADEGGRDGDDDYWTKRIGSRFSDNDALQQVSPLYNIENVTAPILLIHSEDDIVVPEGQSRRMRNALRDAGKEHEYIILEGEDHWLSMGDMRTEMLRASIDFIDRHIGQ